MLVLALADARNTSTLGPVAAIGVACAHGRGADAAARAADDLRPQGLLAAPGHGRVRPEPRAERPRRASGAASATRSSSARCRRCWSPSIVFIAGALGVLAYKVDYSTTTFFKKSVDSVEGFEVLGEAFPAGDARPDDRAGHERGRGGHGGGRQTAVGQARGREGRRERRRRPGATPTDGAPATIDVDPRGRPARVRVARDHPRDPRRGRRRGARGDRIWSAARRRSTTTSTRRSRATSS